MYIDDQTGALIEARVLVAHDRQHQIDVQGLLCPAERADLWVANYYSARNPLRLSSLVILGVVARMFRCATRSSCWCT